MNFKEPPMLSRRHRIALSLLLFWTSMALLPIQQLQAGLAPMWLGRFIDSVCYGGVVDWTALGCCGLHIWAKVGLFGPSLGLVIVSVVLLWAKQG
jgi:hypothetical protein